jgi:hypothetical protein
VRTITQTKNLKVSNSRRATSIEPYQNTSPRTCSIQSETTSVWASLRTYEEHHSLGERKRPSAEKGRPVRNTEWLLQTLTVQLVAVVLTGQGCDGANRTSGFASKLSRIFVGAPVGLILQYDDAKANVAGSDDEGDADNGDEGELPAVSKSDGGTANNRDDGLDNGTESDTGQSADFLWSIAEVGGERASAVLLFVEIRNWEEMSR